MYSAISSPGGTRDLIFDATLVLEAGETLSTVDATSAASFLDVTGAVANAAEAIVDGITVAIGKGILFNVSTNASATADAIIVVTFTGDQGSADTYHAILPVTEFLNVK